MKFLVLFPLLLSITLSQNTNDVYKRILKRINVTNAIEIRASNKTEMNNKVNAANVSESVKEWVKNSSPNKTNSKSNIDLSYEKNEGGKAKLLVSLVEGGLSGYLKFQKNGNKLVRQLQVMTNNLFEDEKYRNLKGKADSLEYQLWDFKEETEEKKKLKEEYNKLNSQVHNYVDMKVREFFNPKLIIPLSVKRELDNVLEMYEENMENDDQDIFSGTEDSYANEMLGQDLFDVLSRNNVEQIMALNNNMYTLLNIDFRNKGYDEIVEQITDKLYKKFMDNLNNLNEIIETKNVELEKAEETIII